MPSGLHPLLVTLCGGDRRSIGEANRAAQAVAACPELMAVLFQGLASLDPVLRMRCADAIEKASRSRPDLLLPFKEMLLQHHSRQEQQEVRWHVAPLLVRLPLDEAEQAQVLRCLLNYMNDRSSIVKTMSMQALADLALAYPQWLSEIRQHLEELTIIGSPAMQARGRKLLKALTSKPFQP